MVQKRQVKSANKSLMKTFDLIRNSDPKSCAQSYITDKVGLNIRIKNVVNFNDSYWRVNLYAVIPFKVTFANEHTVNSSLTTRVIEGMILKKKNNKFFVWRKPDLKKMDERLNNIIKDFNSKIHVTDIQWDGKRSDG